ncbi:MAG: hypothetical protein JJU33_04310 [Phycisphaerales bacterium]|nr:hypothetical protein [Phycisphaerales bacterium]
MARHPTDFIRFLAKHYQILSAMCRENRRFTSESELEVFCGTHSPPDANAGAIARRLRELGAVTQATGDWAPPPYLRAFLAELEQRHALASPGVVRGWVEKLIDLASRLESSTSSLTGGDDRYDIAVVDLFDEITDTLASIAGAVGANCDRIGNEVSKYRSEEDATQIRKRLSRLVDLHASYLEPVLGLVDIGGDFHMVCERIASDCESIAQDTIGIRDDSLRQAAITASRDVVWLRRSTLRRAHEANRELGPLCEAAARESTITRGVNRALEAMANDRWDRLGLHRHLQVVIDQDGPIISDRGAKTVVSGARSYRVEPPPLLGTGSQSEMDVPWGAGALLAALEASSHVPDVLEWICDRVGWEAADGPAGLLYDLLELEADGFAAGAGTRTYVFRGVDMDAHIWAWRAPAHD